MKYLINNSNNPFYNLAFEEYVFKNIKLDEDYFFLWQNCPTVVIGKNQNTYEEINSKYIKENNINVVRRITGGGAVYHDLGNISFSFIIKLDKDLKEVNFKKYTEPIIKVLRDLNINAELSGRNDILVDNKKISGNSQRLENNVLLHHGTLIYDLNIDAMVRSLNVSDEKFISKSVKSIRSRVTNLKDYLHNLTLKEFIDVIHKKLADGDEEIKLTEKNYEEINNLKNTKYDTWEWNYGTSPQFTYKNKKKFDIGFIEVYVDIEKSHIKKIRFIGDYIGLKDISQIENSLVGIKYEQTEVAKVLNKFNLLEYFGTITKEEIINLIF